MIYTDGTDVMVDGVILPGILKSIEVTTAAEIEEQEVEGSTAKPKQATGYEDGKVSMELILLDSEDGTTKQAKLAVIQGFFRSSGQDIPAVHSIINEHTAQRGITQVLFKSLATKETNANDQLTATLEFWEYVPMTISIEAASSAGTTQFAEQAATGTGSNLNADYVDYLGNRGQAPKQSDKTRSSPARDSERVEMM